MSQLYATTEEDCTMVSNLIDTNQNLTEQTEEGAEIIKVDDVDEMHTASDRYTTGGPVMQTHGIMDITVKTRKMTTRQRSHSEIYGRKYKRTYHVTTKSRDR
eukprot:3944134-Ditylum_brightwellii.AAC.1